MSYAVYHVTVNETFSKCEYVEIKENETEYQAINRKIREYYIPENKYIENLDINGMIYMLTKYTPRTHPPKINYFVDYIKTIERKKELIDYVLAINNLNTI